jgi:hypothetical protein
MKSTKVTDPAILAQLNGGSKKVTDPALLAQLNGEDDEEEIPYTPPPERKGLSGIWEDVKDIPGKVLDYGLNLPGKAVESWKQIGTQPGRALKNLIAGAGETLEAPVNLLGAVGPYLKERGITDKIPGFQVPDTGIEKVMGLDKQQPGDELIRQMFMFSGVPKVLGGIPGVKTAGKRIKAMGEHAPLTKKLEELEGKHETARTEHGAATDEYNALKNYLESQPGFESSNPHALERKATEAEQKIAQLREQSEAVPEHLRATEEPTAPEKTPISLVEPVRPEQTNINELPKTEVSDEGLKQAESLLKTNEQKSAEHEAAISQHLGEGNAHRKRVAQKLNPILEARQAEIGKGYDEYINGLKDKQVTLSNPREAKAITQDIHKLLKEGDTSSKEMIKLTDELANLGKGETMPADKFVSAYRSLRGMAQKTRSSAYGKAPQEFDRLIEAADSMDADVAKMAKIIDSGLGEENLEQLHGLNHRYATEVAPLFKNKFFQHMQANNKAPTNMIEQLTNEPYIKSTNPNKVTGTQILNEIIKGDPELLQNVVGERFAHKPEALHQWDEAAHSFIEHMPELKEMRGKHFESKQAEAQSKLDLEKAKHEHQMQREQATAKDKEAADAARLKNTKAREEAAEQTRQKKAETHKENQTKQQEHEQKAKHYKMQQEINGLEEKSVKLKDSAAKLHEKASRKNISLKEKMDLEHELKQTKEKLSKIEKDIKIKHRLYKIAIGTVVGGAIGVPLVGKAKTMIGGN